MCKKVISILGPTECPHCHSALVLYREQTTSVGLDKNGNGIPTDNNMFEYEEVLKCENCFSKFPCIQLSNGRYTIYTDLQMRLDIYRTVASINRVRSPFIRS